MDWTLVILLAALLLTFLAWSRARRQTAEASEATLHSKTYTLDPQETTAGRGFAVLAPDGTRLDPGTLSWSRHGLESVPVVGLEEHTKARQDPAFAAGQAVELIVEGGARSGALPMIEVWNGKMTARAGRISEATAHEIARRIDAGEVGECMVLWEELGADPTAGRTALLLLLIHRDVGVEG